MTSREFAQKLWSCAPPEADMVAAGLELSFARETRESCQCLLQKETTTTKGPLIHLVANYDVSKIAVGGLEFVPPTQEQDTTVVAKVDSDPIYVRNGRVYWAYHTNLDDIISICAASQEQFLDALATLGCYFMQAMMDDELYEDEERTIRQATICGDLAGGTEYRSFWAGMIGCK